MAQRRRQSDQALALLYHARAATPFLAEGGEPCASIPASVDSRRVVTLRSADFRDWLTANYYSEFESPPSPLALRAAVRTLEARAKYGDSPRKKVDYRVSAEGDPFAPSKIFLDLGNTAGEILEITSESWRIVNNLRQTFRRSSGMLALPTPEPVNSHPLSAFATLFHLSPTAHTRILFWLMAALRPLGPYPILVIRGAEGSGKSFLARALRSLVDPSAGPLRRLPVRDRELVSLAMHNWILAFDAVHRIPGRIAEALRGIASGEAIETIQPDQRDSTLGEIARPIILIATSDEAGGWTPARRLVNRTLTIDLMPVREARSEAALWSDLAALRASMLAALAEAVSCALRHVRDIDVAHVARFPDATAWAVAAAPALGIDAQAMLECTLGMPQGAGNATATPSNP